MVSSVADVLEWSGLFMKFYTLWVFGKIADDSLFHSSVVRGVHDDVTVEPYCSAKILILIATYVIMIMCTPACHLILQSPVLSVPSPLLEEKMTLF